MSEINEMVNAEQPYLAFYLGDDLYAVELQSIREIIEPLPVKKLGRTISSFLGICNLRGELVGVIDLRSHFGYENVPEATTYILFESPKGSVAVIVDKLDRIYELNFNKQVQNTVLGTKFPKKYIRGSVDLPQKILSLIDMPKVLEDIEFASSAGSA